VLQGYNASPVGGIGRHDQPAGAAEGLRQASAELRSGFGAAAQAVVVRPARTLQQDGVAAAFGARQLPQRQAMVSADGACSPHWLQDPGPNPRSQASTACSLADNRDLAAVSIK